MYRNLRTFLVHLIGFVLKEGAAKKSHMRRRTSPKFMASTRSWKNEPNLWNVIRSFPTWLMLFFVFSGTFADPQLNEYEIPQGKPPSFVTPGQTYRIASGATVILPCRITQPGKIFLIFLYYNWRNNRKPNTSQTSGKRIYLFVHQSGRTCKS